MARTKKYRPDIGDIVEIQFYDHVSGGAYRTEVPMDFTVWGRIQKIGHVAYLIHSWAFTDPNHEDWGHADNVTAFTIVKSTVISIRKIG